MSSSEVSNTSSSGGSLAAVCDLSPQSSSVLNNELKNSVAHTLANKSESKYGISNFIFLKVLGKGIHLDWACKIFKMHLPCFTPIFLTISGSLKSSTSPGSHNINDLLIPFLFYFLLLKNRGLRGCW